MLTLVPVPPNARTTTWWQLHPKLAWWFHDSDLRLLQTPSQQPPFHWAIQDYPGRYIPTVTPRAPPPYKAPPTRPAGLFLRVASTARGTSRRPEWLNRRQPAVRSAAVTALRVGHQAGAHFTRGYAERTTFTPLGLDPTDNEDDMDNVTFDLEHNRASPRPPRRSDQFRPPRASSATPSVRVFGSHGRFLRGLVPQWTQKPATHRQSRINTSAFLIQYRPSHLGLGADHLIERRRPHGNVKNLASNSCSDQK